jgi:hypothetical protein
MTYGLARVLRPENPNLQFVTSTLQDQDTIEGNTNTIGKVVRELDKGNWSTEDCEMECVARNGMLQDRRVVEEEDMNMQILLKMVPRLREESWGSACPLVLTVTCPGLLDSLCFVANATERGDQQP